jgi:hypothetical protein
MSFLQICAVVRLMLSRMPHAALQLTRPRGHGHDASMVPRWILIATLMLACVRGLRKRVRERRTSV